MRTLDSFIATIQEQHHFDCESGTIGSVSFVRSHFDDTGRTLQIRSACFPAFRQREKHNLEDGQDVFWVLADDLTFALDGVAIIPDEMVFMPGEMGDGWNDELILDCAASLKRVIDLWWNFATEEGDNDFVEILTTLPFGAERYAAIPKQVSAYIDGFEPIDGDPTIALFSLGLWLRRKFGLGNKPLHEALSYANNKSVSRLTEFAIELIGYCVDETQSGSQLEYLILQYPKKVKSGDPFADRN